jgi:hypothetical protein
VLDDGLKLWRESIPKTWPLAVLAQLVVAVPLVLLAYKYPAVFPASPTRALGPASAANAQAMLALFTSPATWLTYLAIIILSVECYAAIVLRVASVAGGTALSLGGSLSSALRLLPRLLLQFLLFLVAIFVAALVTAFLVGLGAALAGSGRVLAAAVYFIIFLAAVFVFGRVFFASWILILDDAGAAASIGASWRLTQGYWWRCAAILTVLIIIALVFTLVVGFLAGVIGAALGQGVLGTGLSQLVSLAANAVLGSLYPAVSIAILYDLRLRKQGGDLMGRVDALARQ